MSEIVKTEGICLSIHPWSRTSHVVVWMTPAGKLTTVVKGALRPKSFFLGQYDLNYRCEILYYVRSRGETHPMRECYPLDARDNLRDDWRALALASYFRALVGALAPAGQDAEAWYRLLDKALAADAGTLRELLVFELKALALAGLKPEIESVDGAFALRGERRLPVSPEVVAWLRRPDDPRADEKFLLDAVRVIGVFYILHVEFAADVRRNVITMISKPKNT